MSVDPKNGPEAAEDASAGTAPPMTESAAGVAEEAPAPEAPARAGAAAAYAARAADSHGQDDGEPPRRQSPPLTRALAALGLVLGGGAIALTAAPSLPGPIASLFGVASGPAGSPALEATVASLGAELAAAKQAADTALAAVSGATSRLAEIDAAVAALADDVAAAGASPGGGGSDPALAERLAQSEGALESLRAELLALSGTLAQGGGGGGAMPADLEARVAALEAGQQDELAWRAEAVEQADAARRYAAVTTALSQIDRAMTLGAPFPQALDELVAAAGEPAPEVLTKAAADGAPTREALKATFPAYAHEAIEAALVGEAAEDDGALAGIIARVQARVTGLPTEAVKGDSAPAVLSRARVALFNGDIDAALAAVAALPAPSQAAMAEWVAGAALRAEADAALAAWRSDLASGL
jgi:hypothetical protein